MADQVTKALLKVALDAASLRHQVIASNLANIHSVDHVPLRVNFDQQLQALRVMTSRDQPLSSDAVAELRPFVEPDLSPRRGSAAAMIDMEMVKLAQNAVHYQALLKALQTRGSIIDVAVNQGGR
jgi:flagellar basal-body rod protein FlgB